MKKYLVLLSMLLGITIPLSAAITHEVSWGTTSESTADGDFF